MGETHVEIFNYWTKEKRISNARENVFADALLKGQRVYLETAFTEILSRSEVARVRWIKPKTEFREIRDFYRG